MDDMYKIVYTYPGGKKHILFRRQYQRCYFGRWQDKARYVSVFSPVQTYRRNGVAVQMRRQLAVIKSDKQLPRYTWLGACLAHS